MKFRRSRRFRAQLDLLPLIDVIFLLLIFFMVSTTFISMENKMKVDLPSASTGKSSTNKIIAVTVLEDGTVFLGEKIVSLSELQPELSVRLQEAIDKGVVIKADRSARHGLVVSVMDRVKKAGAERLALATEPIESR
jgi:biopolymer transport protein ExbD